MKSFPCLLLLALVTLTYGATNSPVAPEPFTAKEIRQGYRDHVILAKPHPARRATADEEESRERIHVREKLSRLGDLRIIDLDDADQAEAAISRLRATGRYEFVEPDYIRYLQSTPNDPKFIDGSLWAFNNTGQTGGNVIGVAGADIKAQAAWDIIHDAPNVVVAVVDTGVNLNHQDLAANLWTNSQATNNDLHGANFVGGRGSLVSGDPTDDSGHGTHVAGTIGALGNNALAVCGVAWNVKIMAVKVFPASGTGSVSEIAAGVNYAINHGAKIINASYGAESNTGYSQTELNAIMAARNEGVIFVAAAGNDATNLDIARSYPASFPLDNIVTVGASNRRDEISSFSNFGGAVDLYAPGEEIVSLDYKNNTGTASKGGTSMATPHVAGALALLKAQFPNDTYRQLINRLLRGAERGVGDKFNGKAQTGGRLNLLRALTTTSNTPFNDRFDDRPHFTSDNLALRASNAGATAESEPSIAGFAPSATLWWEWTAPAGGVVSISTSGSGYDTLLAVYTGNSLGALSLVASNDNDGSNATSRLTFTATGGATYQIAVDGKNGATGLTLLNVGTIPANDAFASPVVLTGVSARVTATNANCSRETGEPRILPSFAGGTSLWYRWTAPRSGRFQVSAYSNDFDPLLAIYTGTSLTSLTTVSASDNTGADNSQTAALCTVEAVAGTTYLITVDSKSASSVGQFTLTLVDSVWQATTGAAITGPPAIGSDGTVYVGSTDRSLYAFAADGTQKWSAATGGLIDTCSPAIAEDGTVYVGSNDGKLYAFNPDGTQKWTAHDFKSGTTAVGAGCSPAIGSDGTVYIRVTDGFLHAINPADGSERWKANVNATTTTFYGNPVIGPDGTIYQGSDENDAALYAINPDGSRKWRFAFNAGEGVYGAPAIDAAGNLYVATLTGGVYSVAPNSTRRWRVNSGGNISSSVALSADGSTLYYAGYDSKLYARDTATGVERWAFALGAEVRASSPSVDANGVIYIGCYDFKLYAIPPNGDRNDARYRTYDTGNWIRSSPGIAGTRLYVGGNDQKLYAFDLAAGSAGGPWPQYRHNARRLGRAVSESFGIDRQPQSQTAVISQPLTLTVNATGTGPFSYQWKKDGAAIAGATTATYSIASVTSSAAGSYTVTVTSGKDSITSAAAVVTVVPLIPGRLMNVSVRTTAGTAAQTLIVGFVVDGPGGSRKPLLIRGIGPTLIAYGVSDAIANPTLQVKDTGGVTVKENDDWGGDQSLAGAFASVGAFALPTASTDAALTYSFTPGNYTAQINGVNGATGTALAEAYDLEPADMQTIAAISRIRNVSARAQVGAGGNVLIAGFVISGNAPKRVLVRGIGPTLAPLGVTGVLADPQLTVFNSKSVAVTGGTNDNWGGATTLSDAFTAVGAFALPTGSRDAALLLTLAPGAYTAQVSGVAGTSGVALIEVYEMP